MDRAGLEAFVAKISAPVILVHASAGAEAVARRNGVAVCDLLQPFADVRGISVPVRTGTRSTTLSEFSARLIPSWEFACAPMDVVESHLVRAVSAAPAGGNEFGFADGSIANAEDTARLLNAGGGKGSGKGEGPSPSYAAYRRELYRCLRCLPQEQRDCPAALLVVASTSDASPVAALHELAVSALPRPFALELYDPDLPRFYILLHDVSAARRPGGPPPPDPAAVLREARTSFPPPSVQLVNINSAGGGAGGAAAVPDLWAPHMQEPLFPAPLTVVPPVNGPGAPPQAAAAAAALGYVACLASHAVGGRRGGCLTLDDVGALRGAVLRVIVEGVLPALESRMFALNGAVAANRKGLRDVVRSWWRASDSPGGSGTPPGVTSSGGGGGGVSGLGLAVAGQAFSVGSSLLGAALGSGGGSSAGVITSSSNSGSGGGGGPEDSLASASAASGGGGAAGSGSDVANVCFPAGSLESQLRSLGDVSLALREYETAAGHFKRLREELRPERHPAHYASACEGAALSILLSSGPSRDVDVMLETAVTYFLRSGGMSSGGGGNDTISLLQGGAGGLGGGAATGSPASPASGAAVNASAAAASAVASASGGPPLSAAASARRLSLRLATRAVMIAADAALAGVPPPPATAAAAAAAVASAATAAAAAAAGATGAVSAVPAANSRCREAAAQLRRLAGVEADAAAAAAPASHSGSSPVAAALLMEAAALSLLRCSPPSFRKAAASFVSAGSAYATAGQLKHSVRCVSLAMTSYGTQGSWALLEDAAVMALASRLSALGDAGSSSAYLAQCLSMAGGRTPQPMQRALLTALLRSFAAWDAAATAAATSAANKRPPPPATLSSPGLPLLSDRSFEVCSWGDAATAGIAVAAARNGAQGTAGARALCAGVLDRLGVKMVVTPLPVASATAALSAANGHGDTTAATTNGASGVRQQLQGSSGIDALRAALLRTGSVRPVSLPATASGAVAALVPGATAATLTAPSAGTAPPLTSAGAPPSVSAPPDVFLVSALWDGCKPGEGPPGQPATSMPWAAQESATARDLKFKERYGDGAFFGGGEGQPPAAATPFFVAATATDWIAVCRDLAVALEDEAEAASSGRRNASGGGSGSLAGGPWASYVVPAALGGGASGDGDPDGDTSGTSGVEVAAAKVQQHASAAVAPPSSSSSFAALASSSSGGWGLHPPDSVSRVHDRPVREPFAVSFTLTNPLAMELPVLGIALTHKWLTPPSGADDEIAATAADAGSGGSVPTWLSAALGGDAEVVTDGLASLPVDIVLGPCEKRTVRLVCRPLRTGTLLLTGCTWYVAGLVRCRQEWALTGPPLNDTRANKSSGARAQDRRIEMRVVPPAAWASVEVHGLAVPAAAAVVAAPHPVAAAAFAPAPVGSLSAVASAPLLPLSTIPFLDGEVRQCSLSVTNTGHTPLDTLLMRTAGKGCVTVAVEGAPEARTAAVDAAAAGAPLPLDGLDGSLLSLLSPDGTAFTIAPGATRVWRLYVRATSPGLRTLRLMLWYGSGGVTPVASAASPAPALSKQQSLSQMHSSQPDLSRLRSARLCFRLRVTPALSVVAACQPSPWVAGEYLLRVGVAHVGTTTAPAAAARGASLGGASAPSVPLPIELLRCDAISDHWEVRHVDERVLCRPPVPSTVLTTASGDDGALVAPPTPRVPALAYREARVLTFIVRPAASTLDGVAAAAPPQRATAPAAPHSSTTGPSASAVALVRAERGHVCVALVVRREQAREHDARRAAAAADALPPTLRSIAQGRMEASGGGGGAASGGDGSEDCAVTAASAGDPLPASTAALRGGRGRFQLVLSWAAWRTLEAALSDGAFDGERRGRAGGQAHVIDVRTGSAVAIARAGPRWPAWAPDAYACLPVATRAGCVVPLLLAETALLSGVSSARWPLITVHIPEELPAPEGAAASCVTVPVSLVCYNPFPASTAPLRFGVSTGVSVPGAQAAGTNAVGGPQQQQMLHIQQQQQQQQQQQSRPLLPGSHVGLLSWEGVRRHVISELPPGARVVVVLRARVALQQQQSATATTSVDVCDSVLVQLLGEGEAGAPMASGTVSFAKSVAIRARGWGESQC